jgi:ketosteroid isomerase-like protein
MKAARAALLIVLLGLVPVSAAAKNDPDARAWRTSDADVHRILGLEDRFARALPGRDRAAFEKLLWPGFVYTEDAQMMSREELLRALTTGTDRVREAHNEGMRVHGFGGTAVVTGWLVVRGQGAEGRFNRRYRFTDTWMRRGEEWRLVAAQDYLVPAKSR